MTNKSSALHGLYGITDATLLPSTTRLTSAVEAALKGGMRILQYRDKQRSFTEQVEQALALKDLCVAYDALLIINDSVPLAKEVDAHGVHIGREDGALDIARDQLGPKAIIGCSCYNSIELAQQAQQEGADYVAFGRFFSSLTKPETKAVDIDIIQRARSVLNLPVCAIGGITTRNATQLITQGVDMVAVINDLFSAQDVEQKARQFSALFN